MDRFTRAGPAGVSQLVIGNKTAPLPGALRREQMADNEETKPAETTEAPTEEKAPETAAAETPAEPVLDDDKD